MDGQIDGQTKRVVRWHATEQGQHLTVTVKTKRQKDKKTKRQKDKKTKRLNVNWLQWLQMTIKFKNNDLK